MIESSHLCLAIAKERNKTISELKAELGPLNILNDRRQYRLLELQELARTNNIEVKTNTTREKKGWQGQAKGLLQVLWERGWIDEGNLEKYSMDPATKGANRIRKCLLTAIHTFTRQLWLARNAVHHADTVATTTAIACTAEQIEVSYYHQRPQLLRFDDRHLCDRNLQQLMTGSSPTTRRRWLRLVKSSATTHTQEETTDNDTKFFPTIK
ncbi:hypothetical protein MHU86_16902 [Fragilaria crotonensis]|nr:hypothetical protein MHU86_16902 [Fragilaria crotonensis]